MTNEHIQNVAKQMTDYIMSANLCRLYLYKLDQTKPIYYDFHVKGGVIHRWNMDSVDVIGTPIYEKEITEFITLLYVSKVIYISNGAMEFQVTDDERLVALYHMKNVL